MDHKNIIYVFIDASNLWQAQKAKRRFLDLGKIAKYVKNVFEGTEIKVFYYTAFPADGMRSYSIDPRFRFFTFLNKNLGFEVRKKKLKQIRISDADGEHVIEKGNMDVEMTIDAMFYIDKYDSAVFFTGDSDFLALITHLKRSGKKVYILSTKNNISEELRTGGDGYTDLLLIKENIWGKELAHRVKK
ncbi:MAG: NYN domain-containing protein [Patescibacteria group bacterium]